MLSSEFLPRNLNIPQGWNTVAYLKAALCVALTETYIWGTASSHLSQGPLKFRPSPEVTDFLSLGNGTSKWWEGVMASYSLRVSNTVIHQVGLMSAAGEVTHSHLLIEIAYSSLPESAQQNWGRTCYSFSRLLLSPPWEKSDHISCPNRQRGGEPVIINRKPVDKYFK